MPTKKGWVGGGGQALAESGFDGGPQVFDGIEVGRVGRQNNSAQPAAATSAAVVGD